MQGGKGAKAQPFSEHIQELRERLFIVVSTLALGTGLGYAIHERIFRIVRHPLHAQLYYTTPTGGFNAVIKISILFGVLLSIPVLIYQIGKFLSPAFKRRIKAARIILFSSFLAALGTLFAYYVSLPAALHFLANIDSQDLQSLITVNEYLSFVFAYVAGFAILFQLPLILLFINRIKPQKPGRLMRYQRWVVLISFIVAAILTPTPDPVNQTIMAAPVILLYQISVVLVWLANKKRRGVAVQPEPVTVTAEPPANSPTPPTPALQPLVQQMPTAYSYGRQKPLMDVFAVPEEPAS